MIRIGLTGSIGMGKSTVARMFADEGIPVFDADAAVHRLQGSGAPLLSAIERAFPGTTGPGGVDRVALGLAVFGDRRARRRLERIVHPAVAADRRAFLRRNRSRPAVLLDVPLLFETRGDRAVDLVVVVSAPRPVQRARVLERDGMTSARFRRILAAQLPDHVKRRRADLVIETGRPIAECRRIVRRLVACLRGRPERYARSCVRSSSTPKRRG
ncbi:dephospho-CoA kinase [Sphingomonas jejuensis]|uniref:Dephospho-CoA kinase n=1 Tax=Sphingomonas jejuensis TaxID=904715 RepID=A0ABX0XNK8_9SPHN|nr:dephospho-CoA kinase [Sphingomonas jejuensis]NJC34962.1 dephospho-CoA kinase [Sphingomonas jejuensis]